jgi:hypothetical protein
VNALLRQNAAERQSLFPERWRLAVTVITSRGEIVSPSLSAIRNYFSQGARGWTALESYDGYASSHSPIEDYGYDL